MNVIIIDHFTTFHNLLQGLVYYSNLLLNTIFNMVLKD